MERPHDPSGGQSDDERDQERRNRFAGAESGIGALLIVVGILIERGGDVFDVLGLALALLGAAAIVQAFAVAFRMIDIPTSRLESGPKNHHQSSGSRRPAGRRGSK